MCMNLESIILNEVRQIDKYHMISSICGILKYDTNELIYKTEADSENKFMVVKGERLRGRDKLGV